MTKYNTSQTFSDNAELVQTVNNLVREIVLLHKTVHNQPSDKVQAIAMVLLRQKKSLDKLKQMASDGIALAAAGYVKACCMTGYQTEHIFRFHDTYRKETGQIFLDFLFRPENIIPFLCHQQVVQKVNSLAVLAQDLPNLKILSGKPVLIDALHITDSNGKMFDEQLADRLLSAVKSSEKMEQELALKTLEHLSDKGYPQVQITYATILKQQGRITDSRHTYQSVLMNKFATDVQMNTVKHLLFPFKSMYRNHANTSSYAI